MERMTVAQARKVESVGKQVRSRAGSAPAATPRAASASSNSTTAPAWATSRSSPTAALPNYESEVKKLHVGCSVAVEGEVQASPAKGQATEVQASSVIVYGCADPDRYPLQKKGHSFEFLRDHRPPAAAHQHLRRRRPRAQLQSAARSTSSSRRTASSTSIRRSSPPATARAPARCSASPRSTWTSRRATTRARSITPRTSSAGRPILTVSGQLEAEIFACSLGKVYTFGPTFRAENSNTSRHLAEFWMVEPEMAFYELTDNMDLAEAFLKRIFRDVLEQVRRGHEVLRGAHRHDRDHARWKASSTASSCVCRTPRPWTSRRSRARRSSSR